MAAKEMILDNEEHVKFIEEAATLMELIKTRLNLPFVDENVVRIVKFMCDIGLPEECDRVEYVFHTVKLYKMLHKKLFRR